LKRGFTFYRHHPGAQLENRGRESERLLVAASPDDSIADSHWFRADVDHHFVRTAIEAGVDYRDHVELAGASFSSGNARLSGSHKGAPLEVQARFVIDASGPGGFLARQLSIPSGFDRTHTRAPSVYSHFDGVGLMHDGVPGWHAGPRKLAGVRKVYHTPRGASTEIAGKLLAVQRRKQAVRRRTVEQFTARGHYPSGVRPA